MTKYMTCAVAADAYPNLDGPFLTHTAIIDGHDWNPLCKKVKGESLVYNDEGSDIQPTCKICLKRDPRFKKPQGD